MCGLVPEALEMAWWHLMNKEKRPVYLHRIWVIWVVSDLTVIKEWQLHTSVACILLPMKIHVHS